MFLVLDVSDYILWVSIFFGSSFLWIFYKQFIMPQMRVNELQAGGQIQSITYICK